MKKLIVLILALVLVFSLVACGDSSEIVETDSPDSPAVDTPTDAPAALGSADLSNVDVEIAYGDYGAMQDFMKKVGNFEAEENVVKIDGICVKGISSYNIMEDDGSGARVGLTLSVDGWSDADYPADYTRVQILGIVVTDGWNHYISVLPENITIVP